MDNIDVIVDSREPNAKTFVAGIIDAGYAPKIDFLEAGDFLIYGAKGTEDAILIERKSASDFLDSIEGRIWDQLKRMKESEVKERWVLIEGNPLDPKYKRFKKRAISKSNIWGAERAITKFDTRINHVKDMDETVEWLVYLINKQNSPKKPFALRTSPPNSLNLKEKKLYVLQGFPSIGPVTSQEIMSEFHSIENFINKFEKAKCLTDKQKSEIKKIVS